jgi:tRNA A-37 threonylcarbamoyl transferase component Bud32
VTLSAEQVADLLSDPRAVRIREGERGAVWRLELDSGPAILKIDRPPTLRSRWGSALRGTRAARARDAAVALREAGFLAPTPLGVLEERRRSVFLASWIEGPTLSQAWERASRSEARGLAEDAARLAAALHEAGFRCRDLKPPNLIVSPQGLALVDLDDVRSTKRVPPRLARRNLSALDAYGQAGARPLGVAARLGALRTYGEARGLELRQELPPILRASRRKRRGLPAPAAARGASPCR